MTDSTRIGVFGGSFDPPHHGHLALAELAIKRLLLDELWVIPVGSAIHRTLSAHVTAEQRLQWVKTMFNNTPKAHVLDWEVTAAKAVPSCDTLARIHQAFPTITPIFLVGMDAWQQIEQWVDYPIHCKLCNIAVFSRVGTKPCRMNDWKPLTLTAWQQGTCHGAGHAIFLTDLLPDISATHIRDQLRRGHVPSSIKKQAYGLSLKQYYGQEQTQRNQ